jgi:hypothetical protein
MLKRAKKDTQGGIPGELWAHVCSFLIVRDAMDLITLVLRRPDLRVPWWRLDTKSVMRIVFSHLHKIYVSALKWGVMSSLEVLEVFLCGSSSVASVQAILKAAVCLRRLRLSLHDHKRTAVLACLAPDMPATVSDLDISLEMFDDDIERVNSELAAFLCSFTSLSKLALHFRETWCGEAGALLASTLGQQLKTLRELKVTGSIDVEQDVLDAVVARCPDLSVLTIMLTGARFPEVLDGLKGLTECFLTCEDAGDLEFVRRLPNLQTLHVWLQHGIGNELALPPSLREFRCHSWDGSVVSVAFSTPVGPQPVLQVLDFPASGLRARSLPYALTGLQTLRCAVEPEDVAYLLGLLSSLTRLRQLHLVGGSEDTLRLLGAPMLGASDSDANLPVTILVMEDFDCGSSSMNWLLSFPSLVDLEFKGGRNLGDPDLKRAEAFKVCPKLRSLVDSSTGKTVTVGGTCDGQLVKRMDDRVCRLKL